MTTSLSEAGLKAWPRTAPTVIVVDDDPAVRESLRFSLEIEGFEVEAHATAESVADRGAIPDRACLVIDYRLPGMNGLALLALLRAQGVRAPAVIITSNPTRAIRRAAADADAALIEKPLLCDSLSASLRSLVAQAGDSGLSTRP